MFTFPVSTSAFSPPEIGVTVHSILTHPGQSPLHSPVLYTSQLPHRPSVSTLKLFCMLLSQSQTHFTIRSATLLFLKRYQLLITPDCWDTLSDPVFSRLKNASLNQAIRAIVHLFLIDTEHKSKATAVISCMEELKIPTERSQNVTLWDSLHPQGDRK